jgi:putative transposase
MAGPGTYPAAVSPDHRWWNPRVARLQRRSMRLLGFNYTRPGAYFVTICTQMSARLFGRIVKGRVKLSLPGRLASECWLAIPEHFPGVRLDAFIVMPDHIHGIIVIGARPASNALDAAPDDVGVRPDDVGVRSDDVGARHAVPLQNRDYRATRAFGRPVARSLPTIIGAFKSAVTRRVNAGGGRIRVWQRNYFEHIVRNRADLRRIRWYIATNPTPMATFGERAGNASTCAKYVHCAPTRPGGAI